MNIMDHLRGLSAYSCGYFGNKKTLEKKGVIFQ